MLKAMLEERFGLQARIATKKVEVIALQMAKPDTLGPGLRVSTGSCSGSSADALPNEAGPANGAGIRLSGRGRERGKSTRRP